MICVFDIRLSISISAATSQKHPLISKSNIIHDCKLIVGYCLLKCPKEIISRCHKQSGVLHRELFISAIGRFFIFLSNAVKTLYKRLEFG